MTPLGNGESAGERPSTGAVYRVVYRPPTSPVYQ